jgi:hypothetical protein
VARLGVGHQYQELEQTHTDHTLRTSCKEPLIPRN